MAFWKIITVVCTASIVVDAKFFHQKRDVSSNICDTYNNTNKILCYCTKDNKEPPSIRNAECHLTQAIPIDDENWSKFKSLSSVPKLTFISTTGISLTYVPTEALKHTLAVTKIDIKYGSINTIASFAFANNSALEEITLRDNQISALDPYAFVHHKNLETISLDTNSLTEINRNVFVDLPALQTLFLTNNEISTIHDRAFVHLTNLKELEIDGNKVFSLNYAVFEGLKKLEKLDLSSNSLEVIGDNTFQALENLQTLNLEGNKIQMLDDNAFNGLGKLLSLSLARNKLTDIDSDKVFESLDSLLMLSLKGNQFKELKSTVLVPILRNFYGNNSSLDVEDNNFTCSCRLDWFISLMNKTLNKHLRTSIDNLKCNPDPQLRDAWTKADEIDTTAQGTEDKPQDQVNEYEYYDETQLNGKLFYVDVRELLNCDKNSSVTPVTDTAVISTKNNASVLTNTEMSTSKTTKNNIEVPSNKTASSRMGKNKRAKNYNENEGSFTTTRLATVSAKPAETKIYENMASDEAKPDKNKLMAQEDFEQSKRLSGDSKTNKADKNKHSILLFALTVLSLRLYF